MQQNNVIMKKLFIIVTLLAIHIEGYAVKVETTTNLKVYYPEYTRIDLVCEEMPKAAQKVLLLRMGGIWGFARC